MIGTGCKSGISCFLFCCRCYSIYIIVTFCCIELVVRNVHQNINLCGNSCLYQFICSLCQFCFCRIYLILAFLCFKSRLCFCQSILHCLPAFCCIFCFFIFKRICLCDSCLKLFCIDFYLFRLLHKRINRCIQIARCCVYCILAFLCCKSCIRCCQSCL